MLAACNAGRKVSQVPGRNWFGSRLQPTAGNTDNNMNAPCGFNPTPTGTPTGSQTGGAGITNGAPANGAPTNGAPTNGPTGGGNAGATAVSSSSNQGGTSRNATPRMSQSAMSDSSQKTKNSTNCKRGSISKAMDRMAESLESRVGGRIVRVV